ncbi:MAG: hypothetical protein KBS68_01325 [Clostridiales bacterium]|nr:hypothetical protein [Candidatus Crickella merdequi]
MEYFVSHIGILFVAACVVAGIAVSWQYLLETNARLKRERAAARKREQENK